MTKKESAIFGELDALIQETKHRPCLFAKETRDFSEEDKTALAYALANPKYSNVAIAKVCAARGATFSAWTLGRHRNKECGCVTGE